VESLPLDLADLLASWLRELRGQRKSEHTWRSYQAAVQSFLAFCGEHDLPAELTKTNVIGWLGAQGANQTSTVRLRLTAIKLFARWLAEAEGFDPDPVLAVKAPKMDQPSVPDLSENELRRLLKACDGAELRDKRDKAMLVLLAETGLRAAELLALDVTDVDLDGCVAHVRRGKGAKGRRVRFSPGAAAILDRYVRARHRAISHPAQGPLWISNRGARLTYTGLTSTLKGRAKDAGVVGFHVHRLRHTAAVRWLRSGGTETGLMAQAGWSSNSMVGRYVAAASEQLAGEEFDRLDLGIKDL
jgi:integrase/recombinase XerD